MQPVMQRLCAWWPRWPFKLKQLSHSRPSLLPSTLNLEVLKRFKCGTTTVGGALIGAAAYHSNQDPEAILLALCATQHLWCATCHQHVATFPTKPITRREIRILNFLLNYPKKKFQVTSILLLLNWGHVYLSIS